MGPVHNQAKQSGLLSKRQRRKTQATREALAASSTAAAKAQLSSALPASSAPEAVGRQTVSDPQTPPAVDARNASASDFAYSLSPGLDKFAAQKAVQGSDSLRTPMFPIDASSSQAAATADAFYAASASHKQPSAASASSAFSIFTDQSTLQDKVNCILESFQAMPVVQHLVKLNVPELVAQRACLEVAHSHSKMDTGAALQYIRAHNNPAELNRCRRDPCAQAMSHAKIAPLDHNDRLMLWVRLLENVQGCWQVVLRCLCPHAWLAEQ